MAQGNETEAIREWATSLDSNLELDKRSWAALEEETARVRNESTVDRDFFDAVIALITSPNDCRNDKLIASYLVAAIRSNSTLAQPAVDALLTALEADGELAWVRRSVLNQIADVHSYGGGVVHAYTALVDQQERVFEMVRNNLEAEHNTDGLFERILAARKLADGEPRTLHRLLEQYALATNVHPDKQRSAVTSLPKSYHPGTDDDVDAIEPLLELVIECSRVGVTGLSTDYNPNNEPGFALCRRALCELAFFEPARTAHVGERLARELNDAQVAVLAASLLHDFDSGGVRGGAKLRKTGRAASFLSPLCDFDSTTDGQKLLRRVLLKFGAITLDQVPKAERPKIPKALPTSLAAADKLRRSLKVKRSTKKLAVDTSNLPDPVAELFSYAQLVDLLRVNPRDIDGLGEDLADTFEGHREELEPDEIEAGLRVEDDLDLIAFLPPDDLVPFGKDWGGDYFALSPHARAPDGEWLILRVDHACAYTARIEATSMGEFAARAVVDAWARREFLEDIARDLLQAPPVPEWFSKAPT